MTGLPYHTVRLPFVNESARHARSENGAGAKFGARAAVQLPVM
jgi:hypothetical protein